MTETGEKEGGGDRIHLVVLIHGIRDLGEWEDAVKGVLKTIPGVEVVPLGYEYYDPLRFLVPAVFQKRPQRMIAIGIRQEVMKLENRGYEKVDVSVIAHSFGTHVILGILEDDINVNLKLRNLILCGAVLPRLYNFRKIMPMVEDRILNFVGCRDIWPVMAKIGTFGYGSAGTFGFQTSGPENLYFDFGHGGFFSKKFIKDNWFEVFKSGDDSFSPKSSFVRKHPALVRWLGKLFNGTVPILVLCLIFLLTPAREASIKVVGNLLGVFLSTESVAVEQLETARQQAKTIVAEIRQGRSLAELLEQNCLEQESALDCAKRLREDTEQIE